MLSGQQIATGTYTQGPVTVTASVNPSYVLFSPTHRTIAPPIGQTASGTTYSVGNYYNSTAQRTSRDTFSKGIRESIHIIYDNGSSWIWRRVVFSIKNNPAFLPSAPFGTVASTAAILSLGSPVVEAAPTIRQAATLSSTDSQVVTSILFRGLGGVDWSDPTTAPLDTTRVKIHSDSRKILQSPSGTVNSYVTKRYYPINKRLTYCDDEAGVAENQFASGVSAPYNASAASPQGDVYIFDIFVSGSITSGSLNFSPECTYYWHER